ncbi:MULTISPECIES: cell division protein ZapE [Nocardia]|uniref:cell division protein ZapE n=2 Tax=Nocardiaceae TaxID=85025 RepID=UPI000BEFB90B|nr:MULTISPECIES: cell division protein ZapE [Nocardia]MBF6187272.1 cell division protein ZapE [Nocardia farcinica]MBF6312921.1 cell division protein ZapE [Nocardia farcinica]PEH78702.1 cell division protein ZapE [Nocardia sp. FDAARGOS_372]UEX23325.1 cell division protein ZapE [Nocardia farcinica]
MSGIVELDAGQRAAADRLAALLDGGRPRRRARGVYLHGRPGRGKTMLMDHLLAAATRTRTRRWHFHEFFALLHRARQDTGSVDGALTALIGDAELVCFDEFHADDIGDAMLVARLLDALFARRVPLVVTSNQRPEQLLPNPLFHDRFLPVIAAIRAHLDVVAVDGPLDYRRHGSGRTVAGFAAGRYLLGGPPCAATTAVRIGAHTVPVHAATAGTLVASFTDLCGSAVSAADYVALAARFERWVIGAVPLLRTVHADLVTRWITLIDVLYDADRPVIVHAAAPPAALAAGMPAGSDLDRTVSRLYEISQPAARGAV